MKINALGFVSINDAPDGALIAFPDGCIVFVSEYCTDDRENNTTKKDCFIFGSGEYYHGDYNTKGMMIDLMVDFEVDKD